MKTEFRNAVSRIVFTLALIVPTSIPIHAEQAAPVPAPKTDVRVVRALKEIGYRYTVTSLGNFRISFKLDDGRSHLIFISSSVEKFGSLETRKIWATVMKSKDQLSQEIANRLLMDNIPMKLGAFELTKVDEGGYKVQFAVHVDANCPPTQLKDALRIVLIAADGKEKELTGADEF